MDKKLPKILPFGYQMLTDLSNFLQGGKMIEVLKTRLISALTYGRPCLGRETAEGNSWQILPQPLWETCEQNR